MKQYIIKEQLEELSDLQIERLFKYWWDDKPQPKNKKTECKYVEYGNSCKSYELPLMSIGDMIEFLHKTNNTFDLSEILKDYSDYLNNKLNYWFCDVLWEAVKSNL